jgi:hypothetical protein
MQVADLPKYSHQILFQLGGWPEFWPSIPAPDSSADSNAASSHVDSIRPLFVNPDYNRNLLSLSKVKLGTEQLLPYCHEVAPSSHAEYLQWLRYYLDYCDKDQVTCAKSERVRLFCEKLREKKQTPEQKQRAAHAVPLYFAMLKQEQ